MKKLLNSITALSLLLVSCGNPTNQKSQKTTDVITQEVHQNAVESIELNNGEKWEVDTNMMEIIKKMENDVLTFANNEKKDYPNLAIKLQSNLDLLTSNCTMTGKAHDELHKWLLPYIDLVSELEEAGDAILAEQQFKNIQTSFSTFNQYFQ
jgi:hypothetical protein